MTIPKQWLTISAQGIVMKLGDSFESADRKGVDYLVNYYQGLATATLTNMDNWINSHPNKATCFPNYHNQKCGCLEVFDTPQTYSDGDWGFG